MKCTGDTGVGIESFKDISVGVDSSEEVSEDGDGFDSVDEDELREVMETRRLLDRVGGGPGTFFSMHGNHLP